MLSFKSSLFIVWLTLMQLLNMKTVSIGYLISTEEWSSNARTNGASIRHSPWRLSNFYQQYALFFVFVLLTPFYFICTNGIYKTTINIIRIALFIYWLGDRLLLWWWIVKKTHVRRILYYHLFQTLTMFIYVHARSRENFFTRKIRDIILSKHFRLSGLLFQNSTL